MIEKYIIFCQAVNYFVVSANDVVGQIDLDLHLEHVPYMLFSEANYNETRCWGYEKNCTLNHRFSSPICSNTDHVDTFYSQGDFGYVKEQQQEITYMCEPTTKNVSSLECTDHLKFCRGHNIMVNFSNVLNENNSDKCSICANCRFYKNKLDNQCDHLGSLQSWSPELKSFKSIDQYPKKCDIIISKPTIIMKLDASVNMYHHFCDFFNLYVTQHVNSSGINSFSKDIHILIWDSYMYNSAFSETFKAFTIHPIWNLNTFKGKVVCFNNIIFSLLPRMIFGLYYNTPLIDECVYSGLFKSFSQHILHRLHIYQYSNNVEKIRITFLSRETKYRNVLNEMELINSLKNFSDYDVRKVVYNRNYLTFKEQLQITYNSDIFIGMHGAGLTHLLFLPDWAVLFELYNCEDVHCYKDLARLRGIKYITWEDINLISIQNMTHNTNPSHAKFTNYAFHKDSFLKLVEKAVIHVKKYKYNNFRVHDEL